MTRFLTLFFCCCCLWAIAQDEVDTLSSQKGDSLRVVEPFRDTVLIKSYAKRFSPRKALMYAAILPGLGQVYTKKYWKLPLVYGGFYAIGYGLNFYQDLYIKYKGQLYYNLENGVDPNPTPPQYSTDQLRTIVNTARRQRDFMVILMAGMYLLQIVDAHVDAHLKEFDLNPKLQVRLQPTIENDIMTGRQTGFSLTLKF